MVILAGQVVKALDLNAIGGLRLEDEITLTAAEAGFVTFASIPADATDLVAVVHGRHVGTVLRDVFIQFNSDASANAYCSIMREALGNATQSTTAIQTTFARAGKIGGIRTSTIVVWIPNYASGTLFKSYHSESFGITGTAVADFGIYICGGSWNQTSAITSVGFDCGTDDFAIGTTFRLYKI